MIIYYSLYYSLHTVDTVLNTYIPYRISMKDLYLNIAYFKSQKYKHDVDILGDNSTLKIILQLDRC